MSFANILIESSMPGIFVREITENLEPAFSEFSAIVEALETGKSE